MAVSQINTHTGPPTLQTIPLELQWKVFKDLDYRSAIFLTAASPFFESSPRPPLSFHSPADKLAFLIAAEKRFHNKDRYICFSCRTIKPRDEFALKQITKKRNKGNVQSCSRFCLDCGQRACTRGQQVQKTNGDTLWKCRSCKQLKQHEFCFVCTKCSDCLSLPDGFGDGGCPSCGESFNSQDVSGRSDYINRQV